MNSQLISNSKKKPARSIFTLNKALLIAVLVLCNIHAKALNYYTTGNGAYNNCAIWSPACPGNTINSGDSVFINHAITYATTIKIEGVLTIQPMGSYVSTKKIQIEEDGYLYNNGYLNLSDELHVDGYFINTDMALVKNVHSDGNVCNSDTLTLAPGETYRNHGGLLECCGVLITDNYEADENSNQPGRINCMTICSHSGNEPYIEIGGDATPASVALLNTDPNESFMTSPGTNFCPPSVLPIELISFDASKLSNRHVSLNWVTASEHDNDFFTIEKSLDVQTWELVGTMNGAGTTLETSEYQMDDFPLVGKIIYYRLRQTDYDGSSITSEVRAVELIETSSDEEFMIFPNPSTDQVVLHGLLNSDPQLIQTFDLSGKNVSSNVQIQVNENGLILMKMNELSPGIYLIRVNGVSKRLVKN